MEAILSLSILLRAVWGFQWNQVNIPKHISTFYILTCYKYWTIADFIICRIV